MPKVSVLTPIYKTNHKHLRECIESILNQTFTDFEFIILNDSPDDTSLDSVVKSYNDPRIKYIKNEKNIGISQSRNRLLELAKGEFLAIFDHDDISVPTRLEQQVKFLDTNPQVGVVSGWMEFFDGSGPDYTAKYPELDVDIKIMLCKNCYVAHTASMLRKSVLIDNDIKYESYYSPAEDYRLWGRLMSVTHFYNIQSVLVRYRNHDCRTTIKQHNQMDNGWKAISMQIRNEFPAYYQALLDSSKSNITKFRLRLFGKIPLIKIKNNWVYLFECIPVLKIKWK